MTVLKQLRVELTLPIDPPHPFTTDNTGRPEALAVEALWVHTIAEWVDHTCAAVFAYDGGSRHYDMDDPIPDWVPQPPASWYAIVSDLAAEVLA